MVYYQRKLFTYFHSVFSSLFCFSSYSHVYSKQSLYKRALILRPRIPICILSGDKEKFQVKSQADDPISFLQLFTKADQSVAENQFEISLLQAIGSTGTIKDEQKMSSKLNKVSS